MATRSIVPRTNSEGSLGTTLKRWLTAFIDTLTLTNPLDVASGGTGVTSLTEGGLLVGGGSGDITALAVATNGQVPIGDGTTAPTLATITAGTGIDITNGAGSITIDLDLKANGGLVIEGVNNELAVDLGASAITGTLAVGDGGTGAATFALNGVLYGNAASAIGVTAIGAEGQILRVGATPFVPAWTTATFPATTTVNQLLYSSSANVVAGLATGNSGILVTSGAGVPSIATDIPTAVTIGSAYVYRVGGTDVAVADGGTNKSSWTQYSIPYASTTTVLAEIAPAASSVLVTNGSNVPSLATDIPTAVTIGAAYIYRAAGTDIPVTDGGTGVSTLTTAYGLLAAGTTATGTVQTLAAGTSGYLLQSGGAAALPSWTNTPTLGTPSSGDLRNCSLAVAPAIGGTTPNTGDFTKLTSKAPTIVTSFAGTISAAALTATFTEAADYALCKIGSTIISNAQTRYVCKLLGSSQVTLDQTTTWAASSAITSIQDPQQVSDTSATTIVFIAANGTVTEILTSSGAILFHRDVTGNVGIGTTGPAALLEVKGVTRITRSAVSDTYLDTTIADVSATLNGFDPDGYMDWHLQSNGTDWLTYTGLAQKEVVINDASADVDFRVESDNSTNALFVEGSSGNVGIGTTTPGAKLDVAGDMQVSSVVALSLGGYKRTYSEAVSAALSGASGSIAVNVPTGCKILGVQLRVDTLITSGDGATTWTAAYVNTPTTAITSGQAFTKNTKINAIHPAHEITTGTVTITITPNANTFSGGVVRAIVYYETFTAMGDNS